MGDAGTTQLIAKFAKAHFLAECEKVILGREFQEVVESAKAEARVGPCYHIINKYAAEKLLRLPEKSQWAYLQPKDIAIFNSIVLGDKKQDFPGSLTDNLQIKYTWLYILIADAVLAFPGLEETCDQERRTLFEGLASTQEQQVNGLIKQWDIQAYGHMWMGHLQGPNAAEKRFPQELYKDILQRYCAFRKQIAEEDKKGLEYLDQWMREFTRLYKEPRAEIQCFNIWSLIHKTGDEYHQDDVVQAWSKCINDFRHDKVCIGKMEHTIDGILARLEVGRMNIGKEARLTSWTSKHGSMREQKRLFIQCCHIMADLKLRQKIRAHGEQREFNEQDLYALAKLREDLIAAGLAEKALLGYSGNPINVWFDVLMRHIQYERVCSGYAFNWIQYCSEMTPFDFLVLCSMGYRDDPKDYSTDDIQKKIGLFLTELKAFGKRRMSKRKKGKDAAKRDLTAKPGVSGGNQKRQNSEKSSKSHEGKGKDILRDCIVQDSLARKSTQDTVAKDYSTAADSGEVGVNLRAHSPGASRKEHILSRMMRGMSQQDNHSDSKEWGISGSTHEPPPELEDYPPAPETPSGLEISSPVLGRTDSAEVPTPVSQAPALESEAFPISKSPILTSKPPPVLVLSSLEPGRVSPVSGRSVPRSRGTTPISETPPIAMSETSSSVVDGHVSGSEIPGPVLLKTPALALGTSTPSPGRRSPEPGESPAEPETPPLSERSPPTSGRSSPVLKTSATKSEGSSPEPERSTPTSETPTVSKGLAPESGRFIRVPTLPPTELPSALERPSPVSIASAPAPNKPRVSKTSPIPILNANNQTVHRTLNEVSTNKKNTSGEGVQYLVTNHGPEDHYASLNPRGGAQIPGKAQTVQNLGENVDPATTKENFQGLPLVGKENAEKFRNECDSLNCGTGLKEVNGPGPFISNKKNHAMANTATRHPSDLSIAMPIIPGAKQALKGHSLELMGRGNMQTGPARCDERPTPTTTNVGVPVLSGTMIDLNYIVDLGKEIYKDYRVDIQSQEAIAATTPKIDRARDNDTVIRLGHVQIDAKEEGAPRATEEEYFGYIQLNMNPNGTPESHAVQSEGQNYRREYTVEGPYSTPFWVQCNDPACYVHATDADGRQRRYHPANISIPGGLTMSLQERRDHHQQLQLSTYVRICLGRGRARFHYPYD